jgi:hypothetical protein
MEAIMTITPSKLRDNLYNLLDEVLTTGKPIDIARNGQVLHIVTDRPLPRLNGIVAKKISNATDDELVNSNWEAEWKPSI